MGVISINLFIFFFFVLFNREELYDERLSRTVLDGTDIGYYARLPKIYFTAATMMDEKLTILTLFCISILPIIIFKKLTSLDVIGKYNCSLLNPVFLVKDNSFGNKFWILVEITRIYITFICCLILLKYLYFCLRDRIICVMLHLVSYPYIAFSLVVKMRRMITKFAGYGTTGLLEQSNNKVYSWTITERYASTDINKTMLVGLSNPRIFAIFSKVVKIRVIKTKYKQILRRFCSKNKLEHKLIFTHEWRLLELSLMNSVKKAQWPLFVTKTNQLLKLLQAKICYLSSKSANKTAMKLIKTYSMNIVIRYIAVNRIAAQSDTTPSIGNCIIKNNKHKLNLLSQSKKTKSRISFVIKINFSKSP